MFERPGVETRLLNFLSRLPSPPLCLSSSRSSLSPSSSDSLFLPLFSFLSLSHLLSLLSPFPFSRLSLSFSLFPLSFPFSFSPLSSFFSFPSSLFPLSPSSFSCSVLFLACAGRSAVYWGRVALHAGAARTLRASGWGQFTRSLAWRGRNDKGGRRRRSHKKLFVLYVCLVYAAVSSLSSLIRSSHGRSCMCVLCVRLGRTLSSLIRSSQTPFQVFSVTCEGVGWDRRTRVYYGAVQPALSTARPCPPIRHR